MKTQILIFLILFISSCVKRSEIKSNIPDQVITVNLNDPKTQVDSFMNEIEDVSLIPLKIDTSVILSDATMQLRVTSKYIYIFDVKFKKLYGFSANGNYQFKIDKFGRGPGEYIQPGNFFVSKDSEISIYDQATKKILFYDKYGHFIKEKIIDCPANNVAYLADSFFVAYAQNTVFYDKNKDGVKIVKINGMTSKTFLPLPKWISNSKLKLATGSNFSYQDFSPRLFLPWSNYVYSITPDSVSCKYKIDFREHNIPESFLSDNETNIDENIIEITKRINDSGWASSIDFYQESSNYCFFTFMLDRDFNYSLFSKKSKKTYTTKFKDLPFGWIFVLKPFLCSYKNSFYTLVSVNQLNCLLQLTTITDPRLIQIQNQYKNYKKNIGIRLDDEDQMLISFKTK